MHCIFGCRNLVAPSVKIILLVRRLLRFHNSAANLECDDSGWYLSDGWHSESKTLYSQTCLKFAAGLSQTTCWKVDSFLVSWIWLTSDTLLMSRISKHSWNFLKRSWRCFSESDCHQLIRTAANLNWLSNGNSAPVACSEGAYCVEGFRLLQMHSTLVGCEMVVAQV